MSTLTASPTSDAPSHALSPHDVAARFDVDPRTGLSTAEAGHRLSHHGPNRLAEASRRPGWLRFLDQFRDVLISILLIAAVVSFVVSGELKTPIVVLVVVLLNAIIAVQWLVSIAVASSVLWLEEIRKIFIRRTNSLN